jgi:formylglycine-generating enzyme required for sulfatase activity
MPTPRAAAGPPRAEAKRPRRSLASLLEPDLDEKVLEKVRHLALERKRVLVVCVAALGAFVALIGGVGAGVSAVSHGGADAGVAPIDRAETNRALVWVEPTSPCPAGMVAVPGGRFVMGANDAPAASEHPAHEVTLAAYCIGANEVTTDEYRACSDRGDCKRPGSANDWSGISNFDRKTYDPLCNARDANRGRHPINCVDWDQATQYCAAQGARLPTEAEWELAARGGDGRKFPWGDEPPAPRLLNACGRECVDWGKQHRVGQEAMFDADDGWATTSPVGSFPDGQSRFGARDMLGNVWEWVGDWYGTYAEGPADDPRGPAQGRERVIRGGAWNGANADWVRPTFRYHDPPETKSYGIGFRCAADQGRFARDVRVR